MPKWMKISALRTACAVLVGGFCFGVDAAAHEGNGGLTDWLPVKSRPVECRYQLGIEVKTPGESPDETLRSAVTQRLWYRNTTAKPQGQLSMVGPRPETIRDAAGKILRTSAPDAGGTWQVSLKSPLPSGADVELAMQFTVPVGPSKHGVKGYRELSGVWHPKVIDLSASGGTEGPNAAIASYDATVSVPEGWRCVTSGLKSVAQNGGAENTLRSAADHIADFAVVLAQDFVPIQREAAGVRIELLHRPERARPAEQMADLAVDVIKSYTDRFGFYPQPYLCIIMLGRGFGGGPVGGNIVRVNDSIDRSLPSTAWGVAHEIGHEYWGFECVVDSDHTTNWFGLGMGLHSDQTYCRDREWDVGQHRIYKKSYLSDARKGRDTALIADPLRQADNDVAHEKGFVVIELLHHLLGEERFDNAVREFLTDYRYQRVSQNTIRAVFQKHAPEDLDLTEFFRGWLETSGTLDYGIKKVTSEEVEGRFQIDVKLESQGALELAIPVEIILIDGTRLKGRSTLAPLDTVQFHTDKNWYVAKIDADMVLPDVDRANNTTWNPDEPFFEIEDIDLDDQGWGQNVLRIKIKNVTDRELPFRTWIGCEFRRTGFKRTHQIGMREPVLIAPHEERIVEHSYFIPPMVGELVCTVECVHPTGGARPQDQNPFLRRTYKRTYETPNFKCNELTPLPQILAYGYDWMKKYRDGARIPPFEVVTTEHFVFYVVPNSPAQSSIDRICTQREGVMKKICAFLGVSYDEPVNFFLYPDASSMRCCMASARDMIAYDTTIVEVYTEETHGDPTRELTHIVAARLGNPPALLKEGLCIYMQAGHKWNDKHVDVTARKLLREGRLTPLTELIKRENIGNRRNDGKVAYPESASFVKFLIDEFGKERFLRAYKTLKNSSEKTVQKRNVEKLERIYGKSLRQLDEQWQHVFLGIRE